MLATTRRRLRPLVSCLAWRAAASKKPTAMWLSSLTESVIMCNAPATSCAFQPNTSQIAQASSRKCEWCLLILSTRVRTISKQRQKSTINSILLTTETSWLESLKLAKFADLTATANEAAARSSMPAQSIRNYFNNYDGGPLSVNEDDLLYTSKSSEADMKGIYANFNRIAAAAGVSDPLYMDSNMENDQQMDESKYYEATRIPCEIGLDRMCPPFQRCIQLSEDIQRGLCDCVESFVRNKRGDCAKSTLSLDELISNDDDLLNNHVPMAAMSRYIESTTLSAPAVAKKLTVSVVSKDVRLPEKEVTLAAYTVSDEISGNATTYKYMWSLISQPSGDVNGTMSDQTKDTIKLTNLSEGLYRFKVVVTGTNNVSGEAFANVTVSPQKRINQAPNVVITPDHVTVKLPTSQTILDGGTSTVSFVFHFLIIFK